MRDLEKVTEKVNRGMASPGLWALLIAGLLLTPVTGGVSLFLTILAGIAMGGGTKNIASAAMPQKGDIVAPQAGCIRVVCALGSIVLIIISIMIVVSLLAFNAGVIGR